MSQAIKTKYLCPTNHRGSRFKAIAEAGSVTLSMDYGLSTFENHKVAALALAEKFGWPLEYIGGQLPCGDFAFVVIPKKLQGGK